MACRASRRLAARCAWDAGAKVARLSPPAEGLRFLNENARRQKGRAAVGDPPLNDKAVKHAVKMIAEMGGAYAPPPFAWATGASVRQAATI